MMLAALKASAKANLGAEIDFTPVQNFFIDDFFNAIPPNHYRWRDKWSTYDFKNGKGDRARLAESYVGSLRGQTTAARDWAEFAGREIGLITIDTDPEKWKERLTDAHLERLSHLARVRALDGQLAIDATPRNEFLYWGTIGERQPGFDITFTNQLVASAEYSSPDIHSALRGGLTLGSTDYSRYGKLKSQFWWSTFAFTSNDPIIVNMRGDEKYTPQEAATFAGALAAHELGHMLFQYGHPFNRSACIMSPVPMLRFREAVAALDATKCAVANDPAMKRGAIAVKMPAGLN